MNETIGNSTNAETEQIFWQQIAELTRRTAKCTNATDAKR